MTRRQPPLIARILNWACGSYRPWNIDEWNEDQREQERQRLDNEEQELRIEFLRRLEAALAALAQSDAEQKLNEIADRYCAADRGVHGELIPDCPTEGVAARQSNGG